MAPSDKKVIIVTGASRGIGLTIAEYLVKASHNVVLVSRSEGQLKELKAQFPSQIAHLVADMTSSDTASKVANLAVKTFGKIDGVAINHGIVTPMTRIENSSIDEWKALYDVNFFSALALVKETIPHLRASKGKFIITSSGAASHAYSSWGAYGSSKAAINSLVQHIAVEEPEIVTVALDPGRTDTDMQKEIREQGAPGNAMTEADYANFKAAFENGQLNRPEWPGHVIAKLTLGAKSEFSGKCLKWNGPEFVELGSSGYLKSS
ncbi:NAD(P)-binding protein [Podospora didyma]|uniref:NAD(P)-binding protein n=1 Tax=Podospora didyma TaxID=330526 RepID=A0AAE0U6U1_9PEZI|nr:NAD(P)-binding protein [Podospora didyma]